LAEQVQMPVFLSVHTPQTQGPIIIKEKLGVENQPRDKDMTADEDDKNEQYNCSSKV